MTWIYRGQAEKEFRVEVEAIGHVRHKNLVRLLGYCIEGVHRQDLFAYSLMALFPFFFAVLHDGDCSLVLTACSKYLICCVGALYYWFYLYLIARASSTYLIKMSFDVPILQDACL